MRETTILGVSAAALVLGVGLGCALRPVPTGTVYAAPEHSDSVARKRDPVTQVRPAVAPPEPIDGNSSPEAVHAWRRQDKEQIAQRVDRLSPSEAENLCFSLRLIARDEVFDKINVKGRLKRYVDGLRTDAELADVEAAFHELERDR